MTPKQIKAELTLNDVKQSELARACGVSRGHVYRVIEGMNISHPVQAVIAHAIGKTPEEVFPSRYGEKRNAAKLRELESFNAAVRKAS